MNKLTTTTYIGDDATLNIEFGDEFTPSFTMLKPLGGGNWVINYLPQPITFPNGLVFTMYKAHKQIVNDMIDDGKSYEEIRAELDEHERFMDL